MLIKLLILTGDNQIELNKILSLSIGILSPLIQILSLSIGILSPLIQIKELCGCRIYIILESFLSLSI
jgi:hypothetical protein